MERIDPKESAKLREMIEKAIADDIKIGRAHV